MRIKKILLFILIFFFCLFLKNNVNAYVINEGGLGKFYLQELPFDDSEESVYKSVFLFNSETKVIYCIRVENFCSLGYDRVAKRLYSYNSIDNSTSANIYYYICSLDLMNGLYIGSDWKIQSSSSYLSINTKFEYIGGTTALYPCYKNNCIITSLPDIGIDWSSNFVIGYNNNKIILQSYESQSNLFYYDGENKIHARIDNSSGAYSPYYIYYKDFSSTDWTFEYRIPGESYSGTTCGSGCFLYLCGDVYTSTTNTDIKYSSTSQFL